MSRYRLLSLGLVAGCSPVAFDLDATWLDGLEPGRTDAPAGGDPGDELRPAADDDATDTGRATDDTGAIVAPGSDDTLDDTVDAATPADSGTADTGTAPVDTGPPDDSGTTDTDAVPADTGRPADSGMPTDTGAADSGPDPAPTTGCDDALVCDDLEHLTPGSGPFAGWTVETPNCSGSGVVVVDDAVARSGTRSFRVDGAAGYCNHVFVRTTADVDALGTRLHGRFWIRFDQALGWDHVTFAVLDDVNGGRHLRMGGQSQILMWNRESDDATLPELSPTGIGLSVAPTPDAWHCVAFTLDEAAGTLATSVDGQPVAALQIDGTPTPDVDGQWLRPGAWRPDLTTAMFGWEAYGGGANTVWFDDFALSDQPLACP